MRGQNVEGSFEEVPKDRKLKENSKYTLEKREAYWT
jgi:hypothetical protein